MMWFVHPAGNGLVALSIALSVLSFSVHICSKYKPLRTVKYSGKSPHKHKMGAMPSSVSYYFASSVLSDYLIRSVLLSLVLSVWARESKEEHYALYAFFIAPYLAIYVLYFLRVYFEYQVKFTFLRRVFVFNQALRERTKIRNFYILKGIQCIQFAIANRTKCGTNSHLLSGPDSNEGMQCGLDVHDELRSEGDHGVVHYEMQQK